MQILGRGCANEGQSAPRFPTAVLLSANTVRRVTPRSARLAHFYRDSLDFEMRAEEQRAGADECACWERVGKVRAVGCVEPVEERDVRAENLDDNQAFRVKPA